MPRGKSQTAQKGKAVSRSAKAGLQFPVGRIARYDPLLRQRDAGVAPALRKEP